MSAKNGQQGRRTPLSLTGAVSAGNNKQQNNQQHQNFKQTAAAASNGNSKNDHNKNGNHKHETNKRQQQQQNEKKHQQKITEAFASKEQEQQQQQPHEEKKSQNGVGKSSSNNQKADKQQAENDKQQNGKEQAAQKNEKEAVGAKSVETIATAAAADSHQSVKDTEKSDKIEKMEKSPTQDKKKDDKKNDKKERKSDNKDDKKLNKSENTVLEENKTDVELSAQAAAEKMDVSQSEEKEAMAAPATPSSAAANKSNSEKKTPTAKATPDKNKTPKRAGSSTPNKADQEAVSIKSSVTTAVDVDDEDIEMQTLAVDQSPIKPINQQILLNNPPSATSTPGKASKRGAAKSEIPSVVSSSPARTFSQISGRRSIRPLTDYTPSKLQAHTHLRESYRRINTDLDVSSTTNTSLNVTVGSEVPNNSSFSFFFGRGRKRALTPPNSQSNMELQMVETSPPKRARLEGFFSAVSSPLSLLRSRFAKTSIQSSTPMKLSSKLAEANDDCDVQNVSGISIEEEIVKTSDSTATNEQPKDVTVAEEAGLESPKKDVASKEETADEHIKEKPVESEQDCSGKDAAVLGSTKCAVEAVGEAVVESNTDDIKFTETPLAGTDAALKNKRCNIM